MPKNNSGIFLDSTVATQTYLAIKHSSMTTIKIEAIPQAPMATPATPNPSSSSSSSAGFIVLPPSTKKAKRKRSATTEEKKSKAEPTSTKAKANRLRDMQDSISGPNVLKDFIKFAKKNGYEHADLLKPLLKTFNEHRLTMWVELGFTLPVEFGTRFYGCTYLEVWRNQRGREYLKWARDQNWLWDTAVSTIDALVKAKIAVVPGDLAAKSVRAPKEGEAQSKKPSAKKAKK